MQRGSVRPIVFQRVISSSSKGQRPEVTTVRTLICYRQDNIVAYHSRVGCSQEHKGCEANLAMIPCADCLLGGTFSSPQACHDHSGISIRDETQRHESIRYHHGFRKEVKKTRSEFIRGPLTSWLHKQILTHALPTPPQTYKNIPRSFPDSYRTTVTTAINHFAQCDHFQSTLTNTLLGDPGCSLCPRVEEI